MIKSIRASESGEGNNQQFTSMLYDKQIQHSKLSYAKPT